MHTQTKELIAIGASVTANCLPCLQFHLEKARQAGAMEADIQAAVRLGRMVRKGAAAKWDEVADNLLGAEAANLAGREGKTAEQGCGCS